MRSVLIFLLATIVGGVFSYSGDVTLYTDWSGGYGSCGLERSKYEPFYVAALSRAMMANPPGGNPNNHPKCAGDVCIQIWGARGSVVLKVSDTCWACKDNDVDVADEIFPYLDDPDRGRVWMNWAFVNCYSNPPGKK